MVHIGNRWDELLAGEFASESYQRLRAFLKQEYSTRRIYPHMNDIFKLCAIPIMMMCAPSFSGRTPITDPDRHMVYVFRCRTGLQNRRRW